MKKLFGFIAVAALLAGCSSEPATPDTEVVPEDVKLEFSRTDENIADAQNEFAFTFFRNAIVPDKKGNVTENVVISPLTTEMSLSMGTEVMLPEMYESILGAYGADDFETLHSFNKNVRVTLPALDHQKASCRMDFGFWKNTWFDFDVDITKTLSTYYDSYFSENDFGENDMQKIINEWVNVKTNGAIPELIDHEIENVCKYVSVATLDFKGEWTNCFDKSKTEYKWFTNINGKKVNRLTMQDSSHELGFAKAADGSYKMGIMPFGNGSYEMVFILPDESKTLSDVAANLNYESFMATRSNAKGKKLSVAIPKFEVDYHGDITAILGNCGIKTKVSSSVIPGASEEICVMHGVHIGVDEEGAEVIAATSTEYLYSSPGNVNGDSLEIDRPFIYMIREVGTGLILAIGEVTKL